MNQQGHSGLRRLGVLVSVPAITALTLAACGGQDGGSGDGGAADSFTFTYPATANNAASPWEALAKAYSEASGVEVETNALPVDAYGTTLRTQIQGGNVSTVMVVSPGAGQDNAVLPLAEAGYIEPLGEESSAVIPESVRDLFTVDDKVYAQPTDLIPVGVLWNAGASEESGVAAPQNDDELFQACETLAGDNKSLFALAGTQPINTGIMAMAISATRVYAETPDWNEQRAAGKVTFADSEGWQDTLQTIVDLNENGCFQEGAAGGGFDAITQGLTQGTSLGAFAPGAAATELGNANPDLTFEVQPFPPAQGAKPFVLASPNYALAISSKADQAQKDAAAEFLGWLTQPENAAQFTEISGGVAITGPDENLNPAYEPMADLLENGSYVPLPNLAWPNPGVYDALASGIQGLLGDQGDIPALLESLDHAWDQ